MVPEWNTRNHCLQGVAVLSRLYRGALGLVYNILSDGQR
jgi:hypothetical protein